MAVCVHTAQAGAVLILTYKSVTSAAATVVKEGFFV